MVWTAPRTYTALEVQTAAIWNTHLRDNLKWIDNAGGTSSMAGWNAYTPTWAASGTAQPAIGNGTIAGSWAQVGVTCCFEMRMTCGASTTYGDGHYTFTLPATISSGVAEVRGLIVDSGTATYRVQGEAGGIANYEQYLNFPGSDATRIDMPDDTDSGPTGDIDVAALVSLDDWTPAASACIVAKMTLGAQQSFWVEIQVTTGLLRLLWSTTGADILYTNSTVATGFTDGTKHWVRATMDVDNGAGSRVTKFYTADVTSSTDFTPGTWTQLGTTVTTAGTTSIFNSTALLTLGGYSAGTGNPPIGKGYGLLLNNAYDTAALWTSADIKLMVGHSAAATGRVGWPVQNTVGGDDSPSQKTWTIRVATALTPVATHAGPGHPASTGLFRLYTGATTLTAVGKVNPFTWASGDNIRVWGIAEV